MGGWNFQLASSWSADDTQGFGVAISGGPVRGWREVGDEWLDFAIGAACPDELYWCPETHSD
jgi:hypothetical protein